MLDQKLDLKKIFFKEIKPILPFQGQVSEDRAGDGATREVLMYNWSLSRKWGDIFSLS